MKKPIQYIIIAMMLLSGALAIWIPFHIWPKEVVIEFNGVMYQEGVSSSYEPVTININGHINNRLFGGRTYLGKIIIDKMEVREEWKTQTVKINFNTDGMGVMYYLDKEDSNYSLVPHAYVSMGDMGSSIVLSLIDEGDVNTHMLANSTMIAGPADDRSEAVMLSNELMKKYLDNEIK